MSRSFSGPDGYFHSYNSVSLCLLLPHFASSFLASLLVPSLKRLRLSVHSEELSVIRIPNHSLLDSPVPASCLFCLQLNMKPKHRHNGDACACQWATFSFISHYPVHLLHTQGGWIEKLIKGGWSPFNLLFGCTTGWFLTAEPPQLCHVHVYTETVLLPPEYLNVACWFTWTYMAYS